MAKATKLSQLIKKSKAGRKAAPKSEATATVSRHTTNGSCCIAWDSTPKVRDALKAIAKQREMSLKALLADIVDKVVATKVAGKGTRRNRQVAEAAVDDE